MIYKLIFFAMMIFLFPSTSFSQVFLYEYWTTTDKKIIFGWDQPEDWAMGDVYEVKIKLLENKQEKIIGTTPNLQMEVPALRVGHCEFYVRAKRDLLYSEWAVSSDPAYGVVDGAPQGWLVYWYLAPPGPIIIGCLEFNTLNWRCVTYGFDQNETYIVGTFSFTRRDWV